MKYAIIVLILSLLFFEGCQKPSGKHILDIRIRDPFILVDSNAGTYYMYASIKTDSITRGVGVYKSTDLEYWQGPSTVFETPDTFWAQENIWAPEVHLYKGKYYLFTTFTARENWPTPEGRRQMKPRGSQILVSDSPEGPFVPFENKAHTPSDWMALDGTLWVENDTPYMIFCHEWVQIIDGTMELVELSTDLSHPVDTPITLFNATDAPWVKSLKEVGGQWHGYITDGAFIYRSKTGKLLMIWSSFGVDKYAVGIAQSETGSIKGPWKQLEPIISNNGGHGMIFKDLKGRLILTIHQPNSETERARFYEIEDMGETLKLKTGIPIFMEENR